MGKIKDIISSKNIFSLILYGFLISCLAFGLFIFILIGYYSKSLPSYDQLANYYPSTMSRIYSSDGKLVDEYFDEKRIFVPIEEIPQKVIYAFLAAEDANFYEHSGINYLSLARAVVQNAITFVLKKDRNYVGASTITQQLVKNFLLTKERKISRKIKEALLAIRITKAIPKDRVLELYLNQIYLGANSYGIASASLNYFDKSLDDLTIAEAALLAALPKAPGKLDPTKNNNLVLDRRNWVIDRMYQVGFITELQAKIAKSSDIVLRTRETDEYVRAYAFSETVRKEVAKIYKDEDINKSGKVIITTIDPKLQKIALYALKKGIIDYDTKIGYRGAIKNIGANKNWKKELDNLANKMKLFNNWNLAVINNISGDSLQISLRNGKKGIVNYADFRKIYRNNTATFDRIFRIGDAIIVEKVASKTNSYYLRQVPKVNGGLVAIDPHTGKVLAMAGGLFDDKTNFNRVTQAKRQPGSAIKPFVYLAALENGFSPASIVIDAAVKMVKEDGTFWDFSNYTNEFYGATPLRVGLEKSRNAMTVRIAEQIGISKVVEIIKRFHIDEKPYPNYATTLGASEVTLLNLTNAYGVIANGGKYVEPKFIEKIFDKEGNLIYSSDKRKCNECLLLKFNKNDKDKKIKKKDLDKDIVVPEINDDREQISEPRSNYQLISMMEGVVKRGTAARISSLGKIIAGKTGTTNDSKDAWFIGFTPDLVVGTYIGFDQPKSLGGNESGSSVAVPIFMDFMKEALADVPSKPFKVPSGISFVAIDKNTGKRAGLTTPSKDILLEALREEDMYMIDPTSDNVIETGEDGEKTLNLDGIY